MVGAAPIVLPMFGWTIIGVLTPGLATLLDEDGSALLKASTPARRC